MVNICTWHVSKVNTSVVSRNYCGERAERNRLLNIQTTTLSDGAMQTIIGVEAGPTLIPDARHSSINRVLCDNKTQKRATGNRRKAEESVYIVLFACVR